MKKIVFFTLIITVVFLLSLKPVVAWLDCPYGRVNDPYPGSCFRYLDTNNDRICDHSQSKPRVLGKASNQQASEKNLTFWVIFLTSSFYFSHWYLVFKTAIFKKYKWLNQVGFRFFWNLVLLITFLITGISGLILAFGVLNKTLSLWHNFAGLVFIIVGFFHFLNNLAYFKKLKV